jgi:hypothetical protein
MKDKQRIFILMQYIGREYLRAFNSIEDLSFYLEDNSWADSENYEDEEPNIHFYYKQGDIDCSKNITPHYYEIGKYTKMFSEDMVKGDTIKIALNNKSKGNMVFLVEVEYL